MYRRTLSKLNFQHFVVAVVLLVSQLNATVHSESVLSEIGKNKFKSFHYRPDFVDLIVNTFRNKSMAACKMCCHCVVSVE